MKNKIKNMNSVVYMRKATEELQNDTKKKLIFKKGYRTNISKNIKLVNKTNKLSLELQEHFGEKLAMEVLLNEIKKIINEESVKLSIEKLFRKHCKKAIYPCSLTSRLQSTSYEQ